MKNLNKDWKKDFIGISNNTWINEKEKLVYKEYIKNDFSDIFGNQEKEILELLPDFKIIESKNNYIIMNFIEGKTISSLNLKEELIIKIAQEIKRIHSLDVTKMKNIKVPNYKDTWHFLKSNNLIPKLHNEDFYFEEAMKLLNNNLALCNNDITDGNIILGKNGKITIIDYEYGGINNYLFDVIGFLVKRQLNKEEEEIFIKTYFGDEQINESEFNKIRKFVSYFWSKWSYYKFLETNDKIYENIFFWLSER